MATEFLSKLAFLFQPASIKVAHGGRGGGKCLALGTKVIMFDGTLRTVENVREGEFLMGPDNKPRKVLGTCRGHSQLYKIKQTSGIDYIVNNAHIISLKKSEVSIREKRYLEFNTITNINIIEAYNKSSRWKSNFRGYKSGNLNFPEKPVSIDPWFLGAWLGDGKSNDTIIYSMDEEIINACENYGLQLGLKIVYYEQLNNQSVGIALRKLEGKYNNLLTELASYNLLNNKHIPQEYISNSGNVRLQLLAGLIDTDGYLHNNTYEITQVNKRLAYEIKFLADTLGFRTNIREKKTVCSNNGVEGITHRLSICGDIWRIPCKLKRKKLFKENLSKNKDWLLSQIEIEPVGYGEYAGFSIDGDHLFLLEDGTVTHNTEGFAQALIVLAQTKKLRIACFREFHKSMKESVYQTLIGQIEAMELTNEFDIQATTIISKRTGSEFLFAGLRHNIESIKSMARIDIAWVEEARNISKTSLEKLEPTIRGQYKRDNLDDGGGPFGLGPEIWFSFNPELEGDEVYKRFILLKDKYAPDWIENPRTGIKQRYAYVVKIGLEDNIFAPDDLLIKSNLLKNANEDEWLHVYGGYTKIVLDGAIYAEEIKKVLKEERRGKVPYDPQRVVHTFWDLGHDDYTSLWFVQQVGVEYNLINFFQDRLKKLPYYIKELQDLEYNYGYHYLPHDGDNETLASRSPAKILRDAYPGKVKIVPRVAKKVHGIRAARVIFDLCNFDEENTADGWQCLTNYTYAVNEDGVFSKEPAHNEFSHGADAFQTFALSLKSETQQKKPIRTIGVGRKVVPFRAQNSWMG